MRSLFAPLLRPQAEAPVPYVPRGMDRLVAWARRNDTAAHLRAMGSVGTLFNIVSTTSQATAEAEWKLWLKAKSGRKADRTEVTSHLALDLWQQPNPHMTGQLYREIVQQHLDLTGEGWGVVARNPRAKSIPLELWPVRPDRMAPVPAVDKFLVGYMYSGPDGEQVPLEIPDVLPMRMPNPEDVYRGMGPVQAILTDIDSARYSAEWNRNFFLNSAEPGGVIEVPATLTDEEWNTMVTRWQEQHQGVANAHRVAVIENGKWVNRTFTMRDMQFVELRTVAKEVIREAFGFPKFAAGEVDDVNRATADASAVWFARRLTVPRLNRWRAMANGPYLALFGSTGKGLEFDYESPVAEDEEAENAERTSKASAAKTYIDAGFTGESVKAALELPEELVWEKPEPPAPPPGPDIAEEPGPPEPAQAPPRASYTFADLAERTRIILAPPAVDVSPSDIDLTQVQADFERHLDALLAAWLPITREQRDDIVDQIRSAVDREDVEALARLSTSADEAEAALVEAMVAMAAAAAQRVVDEAAAQQTNLSPAQPGESVLADVAAATALLLAAALANAAGREALRRYRPGAGVEVSRAVREHLEGLSDAFLRDTLGGALSAAETAGRVETMLAGPSAALYGSEVLDSRTCGPCAVINGKWLGNSDDPDILGRISAIYPRGYAGCLGGDRCRGQIVAVWRPEQATPEDRLSNHPGHPDQSSHGRKKGTRKDPGGGEYRSGKDMMGSEAEKAADSVVRGHRKYADGSHGPDSGFALIAHEQGFDGKPRVVSRAQMDEIVAGGGKELFRGARAGADGVTAADQLERFRSGDKPYWTGGQYGGGQYFADRRATAEGYGDGSQGSLMRAALHPDAKVIKWKDLMARHKELSGQLDTGRKGYRTNGQTVFNDPGRLAASLGYDAVEIPSSAFFGVNKQKGIRETYTVVVNRTALVVEAA